MQNVYRIEIVVDAHHSPRALKLLAELGLDSYTLIRGATGSGERGNQFGDDITGVNNNHYILTTCPAETVDQVAEALRPLLGRVGGICLVSEARSLIH